MCCSSATGVYNHPFDYLPYICAQDFFAHRRLLFFKMSENNMSGLLTEVELDAFVRAEAGKIFRDDDDGDTYNDIMQFLTVGRALESGPATWEDVESIIGGNVTDSVNAVPAMQSSTSTAATTTTTVSSLINKVR